TQTKIDTTLAKVDALYQDCFHLLIRWQMADLSPKVSERAAGGESDPFKALQQCATTAAASFEGLKSLTIPRLLKGLRFPLLTFLLWVLVSAPAFLMDEWYYWVLASTAVGVIPGILVHTWLTQRSRRQAAGLFQSASQALADARTLSKTCHDLA